METIEIMKKAKNALHEFHKGNYRPSIEFEMELLGSTKVEAIKNCKRSRVESRHQHFIGYSGKPRYHYAWCKCGWQGTKVNTYEEAEKIKCPNRLRQLRNYRLEEIEKKRRIKT
jgi:hypothetical protein